MSKSVLFQESSSEALQENEKEKKVCYNKHHNLEHANIKSVHNTFKTVPAIMDQDYVV